MSYESPIHVITDRMRMETEGEIIKAIQKVGVYVDKGELLKALAYDRDQYCKGYEDRDKEELVRCKECKYYTDAGTIPNKSCCGFCTKLGAVSYYGVDATDFCSFAERREL